MGFLDKKTRIVDIQLTDLGRTLLAQNQLRIAHYAFSDELIDYSGSISQAGVQSASLDDVVYRNFVPVEASSMGGSGGIQRDLTSFLFTCQEQRDVLPPFSTNVSGALNLHRLFENLAFYEFVSRFLGNSNENGDVVVITSRDDTLASDREAQYSAEQSLQMLAQEDPVLVSLIKK
jgi:hypothetical protein